MFRLNNHNGRTNINWICPATRFVEDNHACIPVGISESESPGKRRRHTSKKCMYTREDRAMETSRIADAMTTCGYSRGERR